MKSNPILIRFLVIMGSLTAVFFGLYEYWLKETGIIDFYLTNWVSSGICGLLSLTGKEAYFLPGEKLGETLIYIAPYTKSIVKVGASCNGLELFMLFLFFIIAYPGKVKYKIPYIAIGGIIVHIINLLRSYWLTLMAYYQYPHYNLFHRYIFIFMIYGAVFILWMVWANKLSKK